MLTDLYQHDLSTRGATTLKGLIQDLTEDHPGLKAGSQKQVYLDGDPNPKNKTADKLKSDARPRSGPRQPKSNDLVPKIPAVQ